MIHSCRALACPLIFCVVSVLVSGVCVMGIHPEARKYVLSRIETAIVPASESIPFDVIFIDWMTDVHRVKAHRDVTDPKKSTAQRLLAFFNRCMDVPRGYLEKGIPLVVPVPDRGCPTKKAETVGAKRREASATRGVFPYSGGAQLDSKTMEFSDPNEPTVTNGTTLARQAISIERLIETRHLRKHLFEMIAQRYMPQQKVPEGSALLYDFSTDRTRSPVRYTPTAAPTSKDNDGKDGKRSWTSTKASVDSELSNQWMEGDHCIARLASKLIEKAKAKDGRDLVIGIDSIDGDTLPIAMRLLLSMRPDWDDVETCKLDPNGPIRGDSPISSGPQIYWIDRPRTTKADAAPKPPRFIHVNRALCLLANRSVSVDALMLMLTFGGIDYNAKKDLTRNIGARVVCEAIERLCAENNSTLASTLKWIKDRWQRGDESAPELAELDVFDDLRMLLYKRSCKRRTQVFKIPAAIYIEVVQCFAFWSEASRFDQSRLASNRKTTTSTITIAATAAAPASQKQSSSSSAAAAVATTAAAASSSSTPPPLEADPFDYEFADVACTDVEVLPDHFIGH